MISRIETYQNIQGVTFKNRKMTSFPVKQEVTKSCSICRKMQNDVLYPWPKVYLQISNNKKVIGGNHPTETPGIPGDHELMYAPLFFFIFQYINLKFWEHNIRYYSSTISKWLTNFSLSKSYFLAF